MGDAHVTVASFVVCLYDEHLVRLQFFLEPLGGGENVPLAVAVRVVHDAAQFGIRQCGVSVENDIVNAQARTWNDVNAEYYGIQEEAVAFRADFGRCVGEALVAEMLQDGVL